ncbi:MAG TPA: TetR/AcrR family transcriptional regulator [Mycobacteriales bacterium]|nr:TetR/AcrR family transcriptional regulator [Mycobacteriales bacterium]
MTRGGSMVDDAPTGPRSNKGERTRSRLLDAAKAVFEEQGFLNARVSDVAERAGLSHGSFYHYFDSKEQIFREVADAVHKRLGAPMADVILAPGSHLAPQERLRQALRQHFESYRAEARIMGVIEQVSRYDDHVDAMLAIRQSEYAEQVAESIRQLQRRHLADPTLDPELTATIVGALTGRFAEMWLVQGAVDATMDRAVEQVSKLLVNAMGLRSEAAPRRRD